MRSSRSVTMRTLSSSKEWRTRVTVSMTELFRHMSRLALRDWREKPSRSATILRQTLACFSMIERSSRNWPSGASSWSSWA